MSNRHRADELEQLFESLPKEPNGRVTESDLREALDRKRLKVSDQKLDDFFRRTATSHEGSISYEEWRDFFLSSADSVTDLHEAFSYYSRTLKTSHDGDIYVSEGTKEHIGYFVAGGIAGITSRTVTAPLDRLKIYLIAQTKPANIVNDLVKRDLSVRTAERAFRPIKDACFALWAAGGVRSLWAGNGINIVKMLPEGAVKFGFYEASKRFFARLQGVSDPSKISISAQLASGGLGGIAAQFTAYPIDTLRFRMQCDMIKGGVQGNQLILHTVKNMWATGGVRTFYRGLWWGLVGQFPYSAIDLTTFAYAKQWLKRRNEKRGLYDKDARPGAVVTAAIGGFSGAFGATLIWPLNLLRTRLQTQGTVIHPRTYTGIVDVTRQTLQYEGWRGLFKGIMPNLIKVVPAVSISYVVYDKSKQAFGIK